MEFSNSIVNVNAFYFHHGRNLRTFPKVIEFDDQRRTFKDGFQYLVKSGERVIRFFDMSDGINTYRLRQENDQWLLIGTRPA